MPFQKCASIYKTLGLVTNQTSRCFISSLWGNFLLSLTSFGSLKMFSQVVLLLVPRIAHTAVHNILKAWHISPLLPGAIGDK